MVDINNSVVKTQHLITLGDIKRMSRRNKDTSDTYREVWPDALPPITPNFDTADEVKAWLTDNLPQFDVPYAYLGDEPNTYHKNWNDHDFHVCLAGSMSYSASEGNLAIPVMYSQLAHTRPQYLTERTYFPNTKGELNIFRDKGVPFFGLESKTPIRHYDVVAFSISYILPFLHIPHMLHFSGIPVWCADRSDDDPVIMLGGVMSYVAEIIAGGRGGIVDIVFIGESEEIFEHILDDIREARLAKIPRRQMLIDLQKKYWDKGVNVPSLYDVEYSKTTHEIVRRVSLEPDLPEKVVKSYKKNLSTGFILTDPFVSYAGSMGMGILEISRGCSSACNFCQESFIYRPYRELDADVAVEKLKELMHNTGAPSVLPAAFTASDHHEINYMLKRLIEEVSDKIDIVSQRADAFGIDPTFAQITSMGGSRSVSVGMEGLSQRMRDIMSKAVTEENLLRTIEFAVKAGFRTVKLYMITNVPGTTDADYEELMRFCDKVNSIRHIYNPKIEIRLNFTPLYLSGHTPFQWHKATVEERSLTPWLPKMRAKGFNARLGSSARWDESHMVQLFHLNDRRLATLCVTAAIDHNLSHFGAIPKGTVDRWEEMLKSKGLSFDWYFQEKHRDWIFSWDHVDILTKKEALWKEYTRSRQAMGHLEPCINECYTCGACDTDIWGQRKHWVKKKEEDARRYDPQKDIHPIRQKGSVQIARLRVEVDPQHRYVPKEHWLLQLRRACYQNLIPIEKMNINLASDTIKILNWISGTDYVDIKLTEHTFNAKVFTSDNFNKWLYGMRVTDARVYTNMKSMRQVRDAGVYEIMTELSFNSASDLITKFINTPPVSVPIPNDGFTRETKVPREVKRDFLKANPTCARITRQGFRGGVERVIVDFRPLVEDIWATKTDKGTLITMKIRGEITPYDVHSVVFKKKWKSGKFSPAARLDFLIADESDQDDFMVPRCEVCEDKIEQNLFGDAVNEAFCLRHNPELSSYS